MVLSILALETALIALYARRFSRSRGVHAYAFPTRDRVATASPDELRALGFSTRKAEYIRDLARAAVSGAMDLDGLLDVPSAKVIEVITTQRGLGRWTADWFLARCLGRVDSRIRRSNVSIPRPPFEGNGGSAAQNNPSCQFFPQRTVKNRQRRAQASF